MRILDFFSFPELPEGHGLISEDVLHISHLVVLKSLLQSNPVILTYRHFSFPFLNILNLKYVVLDYKHLFEQNMYVLKFPFCQGLKFICICPFLTMKLIVISRNVCLNFKKGVTVNYRLQSQNFEV